MLHRLRFALALAVLLASMASPVSAQLTDGAPAPRVSFHLLVRHVNGHAVTNRSSYRQAPRTVGLWQPRSRDELAQARSGDEERDLHAHTVPLLEMEW
jgi:hypothetical protein